MSPRMFKKIKLIFGLQPVSNFFLQYKRARSIKKNTSASPVRYLLIFLIFAFSQAVICTHCSRKNARRLKRNKKTRANVFKILIFLRYILLSTLVPHGITFHEILTSLLQSSNQLSIIRVHFYAHTSTKV